MEKTPLASRQYVSLFGSVNSGKSTLFNKILGQDMAIVSPKPGTTTDPVVKAMELKSYGPIALVDTAGFLDNEPIGEKRIRKTHEIINRTDLAIYVADIGNFLDEDYLEKTRIFKEKNIPHLLVFTKLDLIGEKSLKGIREKYEKAIYVNNLIEDNLDILRDELVKKLKTSVEVEDGLIKGLVGSNSTLLLVSPIDSQAPKGRLILPQVQLIRECLDRGIRCHICRESELEEALRDLSKVDLVVTDSQVFKYVDKIIPRNISLTSFSILFARQKGDIGIFVDGVRAVENLKDRDKILMLEACSHNAGHEDIGRVKIPRLLEGYTNKSHIFDYYKGNDFPSNLGEYSLVVHCGGCMLNRKSIINRIKACKDQNISITNYGVLISYLNGILNRSIQALNLSEAYYDR